MHVANQIIRADRPHRRIRRPGRQHDEGHRDHLHSRYVISMTSGRPVPSGMRELFPSMMAVGGYAGDVSRPFDMTPFDILVDGHIISGVVSRPRLL